MKKRTQNYIAVVIMMAIFMSLATQCKKEEDPEVPNPGPGPEPVEVPRLMTIAVFDITESGAKYTSVVINDGGAEITARGICWSMEPDPSIDDFKSIAGRGTNTFTGTIDGLIAGETYYLRAFATNSAGTGYSDEQSFNAKTETVTDIDGNVYHTIKIGTQVWMVENLKTTKFRDGTSIRNVTDHYSWVQMNYGAYCDYNNDEGIGETYGHLYNYYAVTDRRNIAPEGWHVPSDNEFVILITYLGGQSVAGGKLKETGNAHWVGPNIGATNVTGFNAIPGGARNSDGFQLLGLKSGYWTTTDAGDGEAWIRYAAYYSSALNAKNLSKLNGNSIRCVKDL
jgi:uncharacterized protein (TIGR02145 family)